MNETACCRILTETQVAHLLSDTCCGPFQLLRTVTLFDDNGKPSAQADMVITPDNPFMQWCKDAFPDVMLIKFAQQLGYIIALELLGEKGSFFMSKVEADVKNAMLSKETVTATVNLVDQKKGLLHFKGELKRGVVPVMNLTFCGTPTMIMRDMIVDERLSPADIATGWHNLGEANSKNLRAALKMPDNLPPGYD